MMVSSKHFNDEIIKKRLGQYFTDPSIAKLLISLTKVKKDDIVIDPMAGTGNMLVPLLDKSHDPNKIYGIEIDHKTGNYCKEELGLKNFVIGNSFSEKAYSNFKKIYMDGADLVLTNPPYVRYQSMTNDGERGMKLPTAKQIRNDLLETLDSFHFLDIDDRVDLKLITKAYSGLSDVAVPAWILCAALLKVGGELAIVVPETWLSREYASVVKYILLKWFKIQYIVEDVNRVWFSDAQVKTNLIVAKRIPRLSSIYSLENYYYQHIKVCGNKENKIGINKNILENKDIKSLIESENISSFSDMEIEKKSINHMKSNFLENNTTDWLEKIEGVQKNKKIPLLPYELSQLLNKQKPIKTISFEELGLRVGQGLRTGANKFFYFTNIKDENNYELIKADNYFGSQNISVPSKYLFKVIRKQSELSNDLCIKKEDIKGRVLYIQDAITNKDMLNTDSKLTSLYSVLDDELSGFIQKASKSPANEKNPDKLFPQLSAVKSNIRLEKSDSCFLQRYWYMLPRFTERHLPDMFIPRINNLAPNVYMIKDEGIVVDANFSTIWINKDSMDYKLAYFAILNSTWVKAYLEAISTVMGGGALKVEASHIKKIRIPLINKQELTQLLVCGKRLIEAKDNSEKNDIIKGIDDLILKNTDINSDEVRNYVRNKILNRN